MKKIILMAAIIMLLNACLAEVPLRAWKPHDEFQAHEVEAKGDYIYAMECGELTFGYEPPYRTTVYDLQENPLFTVDGYFAQYFDDISGGYHSGLNDGFGVVWTGKNRDGIVWGVVSDTGEMLMDGLKDVKGVQDGYIYYSRDFGIPLLDRIMGKLGINTGFCGKFNLQGDRLELIGSNLNAPDEQGCMILQLCGWDASPRDSDRFIYVDENGDPVIDCAYGAAYPFVDGAALVRRDGSYMLIDTSGDMICEISGDWVRGAGYTRAYSAPLLPIDTPRGMVLVNRRGEIVNDTPFVSADANLLEHLRIDVLICEDEEGLSHFVDGEGRTLFTMNLENWQWSSSDPKVLWVQSDGLWGRLDVQGFYGEPCSFTSADRYQKIELFAEILVGQLPGGSWVAIGEMGEATGPAEAPDYDGWK